VLGADGGAARVRGIDVEPDALAPADLANGAQRIHGAGRRRAHGGADHRRHGAGGAVRRDRRLQCVGAHGVPAVGIDEPQVVAAEARDLHPLLDGGVGVARGVDGEPLPGRVLRAEADAVPVGGAAAGALAGCEERGQRAARGTVLNDAAAGRARTESLRQPEQVHQPVEHMGLKLGAGGARRPQHALHPEPRGKQIAEDRGARRVGREVGVEVGRLPVREAGQDDLVHVAQHVGQGLALLRRGGRQLRADRPRLRLAEHRVALDLLHVAGDPLDDRVARAPELVRRHVARLVHGWIPRVGRRRRGPARRQ